MSEGLKNSIDNVESKLSRLKKIKLELNKTFKNDSEDNADNKRLIEEGENLKHLIYNFKNQEFEFVDNSVGNNNDISIPYTHLTGGVNSCNLYINNYINQSLSILENLKRNYN